MLSKSPAKTARLVPAAPSARESDSAGPQAPTQSASEAAASEAQDSGARDALERRALAPARARRARPSPPERSRFLLRERPVQVAVHKVALPELDVEQLTEAEGLIGAGHLFAQEPPHTLLQEEAAL